MNIDVQSEKNELEEFKDLSGKVTVAMADILATLHQKNIEYLGTIEQLQEECKRLEEEKKDYEKNVVSTLQNDMGSLSRLQKEKFDKMVEILGEWTKEQQNQLNTMQTAQENNYKFHCSQMDSAWQKDVQPLKKIHEWLLVQQNQLVYKLEEFQKAKEKYNADVETLHQYKVQLNTERSEFEKEKESLPKVEDLTQQLKESQNNYEKILDEKKGQAQTIKEYEAMFREFNDQIDKLKGEKEDYREKYKTLSQEAEEHLDELNKYKLKYGLLEKGTKE